MDNGFEKPLRADGPELLSKNSKTGVSSRRHSETNPSTRRTSKLSDRDRKLSDRRHKSLGATDSAGHFTQIGKQQVK